MKLIFFEQKFKSAVSACRKQYNRALMMISDTLDTDLIKAHRDSVQNILDDICYVFQHLQTIKETTVAEEEKFENAEIQHQDLMHKISNRIQEIESQKYEVVSLTVLAVLFHLVASHLQNLVFLKFLIFQSKKLR